MVLHALGDLDGALHHLEIALALDRRAAARSPAVATDLMNIASVLLTRGEHQRALAYLNEAVDLDSAVAPGSPARAASLAALATTQAETGSWTPRSRWPARRSTSTGAAPRARIGWSLT